MQCCVRWSTTSVFKVLQPVMGKRKSSKCVKYPWIVSGFYCMLKMCRNSVISARANVYKWVVNQSMVSFLLLWFSRYMVGLCDFNCSAWLACCVRLVPYRSIEEQASFHWHWWIFFLCRSAQFLLVSVHWFRYWVFTSDDLLVYYFTGHPVHSH